MANIDKFRVDGTTYDFIDSTARTTANAAVPQTRTVNSKALSSDITLTSEDIGYDSTTTYSAGTIGAETTTLKNAVSPIVVKENTIDWKKNADSTYRTGWNATYYSTSYTPTDSSRYISSKGFYVFPRPCVVKIAAFTTWYIYATGFDMNDTYVETIGAARGDNRTHEIEFVPKPDCKYAFTIGYFSIGGHSTYNNDSYINQIQTEITYFDTDDIFDPSFSNPYSDMYASRASATSNGHIRYYKDLHGYPVKIYNSENAVIGTLNGSDYIKVRNTDLINILCEETDSDYADTELYIYFYDKRFNVDWDLFNYTNESTGEKNRIKISDLLALNGGQFTNIPDGYYLKIAGADITSRTTGIRKISLLIWDGGRFGFPVTSTPTIYDENGDTVKYPSDGSVSAFLPIRGLCAIAKPGYTFIRGYSNGSGTPIAISGRFPAQIVPLTGFTGDGYNKNLMLVKDYDYTNGTWSKENPPSDLSDIVSIFDLNNTYSWQKPVCNAERLVMDKIKYLTDSFKWTPVANIIDYTGNDSYKAGCTYTGVPYRSGWSNAHFVGWHITKHTFINAVNDPDSIFYNGALTGSKVGPFYSLVCSSFGTLAAGFSYPMTNFGLMKDPNTLKHKITQPTIGELLTNGISHCVIPTSIYNSLENKNYAVTVGESSGRARNQVFYNNVVTTWGGIGPDSTYMDHYRFSCAPANYLVGYLTPYDIELATIKNGSARPYRGDRSVYTSAMNVVINIKDSSATRLYYQKFNVTCNHGVPETFTADGDPAYIEFSAGTTQVTLRSKTNEGTYTGENLEDGAVYGVWASIGDEQATAPDNVEYFEWHDVHTNPITYSIANGVLVTDDEFWYAITVARNYKNPVRYDKVSGNTTIPYEAPGYTIDGTLQEHSDYSKYANDAYLTSINAFFKKGKFGAYVAGGASSSVDYDDD